MEPQNSEESAQQENFQECPNFMPPFKAAILSFNFPNPDDLLFIRSEEELTFIKAAVLCAIYDSGPAILQGDGIMIYIQDSVFSAKARQPGYPAAPGRLNTRNENIDGNREPCNETEEEIVDADEKDAKNSYPDYFVEEDLAEPITEEKLLECTPIAKDDPKDAQNKDEILFEIE